MFVITWRPPARFLTAALIIFTATSVPVVAHAAGRMLSIIEPGKGASERQQREQLERNEYHPPDEPKVDKVTFLKIEPPRSLKESIDGLLLGVYTDVPPEFDHYGYEIRRYMAHIAGKEVLNDPVRIKQELANIANAQIIYNYWRRDLTKKISDIEQVIEADPATPAAMRSTFKYNSGVVVAFLTECRSWLDNNEALLKFMLEKQGAFKYEDPIISFDDAADRKQFRSLYIAQQQSLTNLVEYMPFTLMVY